MVYQALGWDLPVQQCRNHRIWIYSSHRPRCHPVTSVTSSQATFVSHPKDTETALGVHQRAGIWVNPCVEQFKLCSTGTVRDVQSSPGCVCPSGLQQQGHTSQHPLGRVLLALEVQSPHVGRAPLACFVQGTRVQAPGVLFVIRDGLDEHNRHGWGELLEPGVRDGPSLQRQGHKAAQTPRVSISCSLRHLSPRELYPSFS